MAPYTGPERRIAPVPGAQAATPAAVLAVVLKHNQMRIVVLKIGLFVIIVQNSLVMLIFWLATLQAEHVFKNVPFATLLSVLMALNALGILLFAVGWRRAELRIRRSLPP